METLYGKGQLKPLSTWGLALPSNVTKMPQNDTKQFSVRHIFGRK